MEKKLLLLFLLGLAVLLGPLRAEAEQNGIASWYSESDPGINLHTANGELFDDSKNTCASWNYPFGTWLRVTRTQTGKSVVCRVNDRGPAKRLGRLVDLTIGTFREIASPNLGLVSVKVDVIESPYRDRSQPAGLQPAPGMPSVTSAPGSSWPRRNPKTSPSQTSGLPRIPAR